MTSVRVWLPIELSQAQDRHPQTALVYQLLREAAPSLLPPLSPYSSFFFSAPRVKNWGGDGPFMAIHIPSADDKTNETKQKEFIE